MVTATRYVRFYEKGLSLPKHAGAVFLTRDQVLGMKLEGDTFTVTGPDASWDGPYSGGKFQIRGEDLTGFRDALTSSLNPSTTSRSIVTGNYSGAALGGVTG